MKKRYVFLEHTADIKFRTYGKTLQEVFEHAIEALAEYMTDGQLPKKKKGKVIEVQGTDQEALLSNFIDELLFLVDAEHFLPLK
ncbi:MAG: archease, partial [Nanoarchaeota archaeon]